MSRAKLTAVVAALVLATTTLSGCGGSSDPKPPRVPRGADWSPAAVEVDGLSTVAESDASGFRLFTTSGQKTFLPGINLGSTTPLHQPGEVGGIPGSDYRRWFEGMGRLGIRVVRVYTLPPPAMYDELARYNKAHPRAPLYLFQGVYLPDESYTESGRTLYTQSVDDAFTSELLDVSKAVHGRLDRPERPGRAGGHYASDVSRWVAGWIVGVEWDPPSVRRTDAEDKNAAYTPGRYFAATADASPTERWIARHLETLADSEHGFGTSAPIAFANWPTTDPLHHPQEPLSSEDLTGLDANHVLPTKAWPGGTFASFHAYPYYPDFQRYEPGLQKVTWRGRSDPYVGYVRSLRRHFAAHMPLLVTETGVPSSLGSAHEGPRGRDQGGHSETDQMKIDADLLHLLEDNGAAAGFLFEWNDEWFKRTWNTQDHTDLDRLALWHDPLTNEQWFGLNATDSKPAPDAAVEATPSGGPFSYLYVWADASFVHIEATSKGAVPDTLRVDADVLPGRDGSDYRITVDRTQHTGQVSVRRALDPLRLDTRSTPYRPGAGAAWHPYALLTNRSYLVDGTALPQEFQPVGTLVEGRWDPYDRHYDSLATWYTDTAHRTIRMRIPWSMLGMADPSAHVALGEGKPATRVKIDRIGLDVGSPAGRAHLAFVWPGWNYVKYGERLKAGSALLARAYRSLAP